MNFYVSLEISIKTSVRWGGSKQGCNNLYIKIPYRREFLKSLLKGPTRGSENFAQNVGSWRGDFAVGWILSFFSPSRENDENYYYFLFFFKIFRKNSLKNKSRFTTMLAKSNYWRNRTTWGISIKMLKFDPFFGISKFSKPIFFVIFGFPLKKLIFWATK